MKLHAAHEAALNDRDPDRPSTRWRKCLDEVIQFQTTYGYLPRSDGDTQERRLFRWLAVQRRSFEHDRMSQAKEVLLDNLANWRRNAFQDELDERWRAKLIDLQNFVSELETMPRYKNFASKREHVLGVWLHNQHQRRAERKLKDWRLEALNVTIPDWASRM